MGKRTSYIHNLASTLLGKLRVTAPEGWFADGSLPQRLYELYHEQVKRELRVMTPETRGKIADCGLAWEPETNEGNVSLYEVHVGSYLGKHRSGRDLVTEIACTAVIAAMADVLRARHKPDPEACVTHITTLCGM